MVENVTFQIGNIIADASIAAFALIVFLYERQRRRSNRLLSLLLISSAISNSQAATIKALLEIGDPNELKNYIRSKTQIQPRTLDKFETIQRNLRLLNFGNIGVLITFALGIMLEVIALILMINPPS